MTDYRKKYDEQKIEDINEKKSKEYEEVQELKKELLEEKMETEETTNAVEKQEAIVLGVVSNCPKLNVRKNPSKDSEIVFVLDKGSEVCIDEENSTEEWYNITHASGVEGFCMKQFVELL